MVPVPARDELAIKLALAATLPGADLRNAIRAQRSTSEHTRDDLKRAQSRVEQATDATELARILALDAQVFRADAEVRWLEHVARLLERASSDVRSPVALDSTPVKRGRPARAVEA